MKSSLRSDEIFGVPPQMKLNPPPFPAARQISSRSDFITAGGFLPPTADLVEKSQVLRLGFFLGGDGRARTYDLMHVKHAL